MATDLSEIELDSQQRQHIADLAAATGRDWKLVLEEALQAYRKRSITVPPAGGEETTALELAERLGIVGSVKNARRDQSTNRKYLEGLGKWSQRQSTCCNNTREKRARF